MAERELKIKSVIVFGVEKLSGKTLKNVKKAGKKLGSELGSEMARAINANMGQDFNRNLKGLGKQVVEVFTPSRETLTERVDKLGGVLSNVTTKGSAFRKSLNKAANAGNPMALNFKKRLMPALTSAAKGLQKFSAFLASPWGIALAIAGAAVIGLAVIFVSWEKQFKELNKSMGGTDERLRNLSTGLTSVAIDARGTIETVVEAAKTMREFNSSLIESSGELTEVGRSIVQASSMANDLGFSVGAAAKMLAELSKVTNLTDDRVKGITSSVIKASQVYGMSANDVSNLVIEHKEFLSTISDPEAFDAAVINIITFTGAMKNLGISTEKTMSLIKGGFSVLDQSQLKTAALIAGLSGMDFSTLQAALSGDQLALFDVEIARIKAINKLRQQGMNAADTAVLAERLGLASRADALRILGEDQDELLAKTELQREMAGEQIKLTEAWKNSFAGIVGMVDELKRVWLPIKTSFVEGMGEMMEFAKPVIDDLKELFANDDFIEPLKQVAKVLGFIGGVILVGVINAVLALGKTFKGVADFAATLGSTIGRIGAVIEGLWSGSMTWGEALKELGSVILEFLFAPLKLIWDLMTSFISFGFFKKIFGMRTPDAEDEAPPETDPAAVQQSKSNLEEAKTANDIASIQQVKNTTQESKANTDNKLNDRLDKLIDVEEKNLGVNDKVAKNTLESKLA